MKQLLEVEILLSSNDLLSKTDIELLVQREEVANLALDKFLKAEISFKDYLDILETCEMSIDSYLDTVENNLIITGVTI